MKEKIREVAERLLAEGRIQGFLALLQEGEHVRPHVFTRTSELEHLTLGDGVKPGSARYPLIKILTQLFRRNPADNVAVMVRGCEERAVEKLVQASQISANRVILVGFSCPDELADACGCLKPYPDALAAGSKPEQNENRKLVTQTSRNLIRDVQFLREVSDRCMKCYGCRNICPVCFCRECTLEEDVFIPKATLPPANPDFLLTRAIHMVGYCVYCGLCEEACPADIPLKTIYKMVANVMNEQQGYLIQGMAPRGEATKEEKDRREAVSGSMFRDDVGSSASGDPQ